MDSELETALARLWQEVRPTEAGQGSVTAIALENRYQIRMPDDFRAYVVRSAPRTDWMHESGIILWQPDRLQSLIDVCGPATAEHRGSNKAIEVESGQYVVFADYLDWCGYGYAICCSESEHRGKVGMVGSSGDHFVADNFCHFLSLMAEDSELLHLPGTPQRIQMFSNWVVKLLSAIGCSRPPHPIR